MCMEYFERENESKIKYNGCNDEKREGEREREKERERERESERERTRESTAVYGYLSM